MYKTSVLIALMIAMLLAGYWWGQKKDAEIDPVLERIVADYRGSSGTIEDPTNSLGLEGADSVGYSLDGSDMTVWYGKQQFNVNLSASDAKVTEYLRALGLTVRTSAGGEPRLWYMGEEAQRYE
ncbi:hypothetical protein [Cohnella sp. GCM10027633]|uniref:hypothetical protein n=1 Tax=unclassified Cohnella TaxID=2636738 RepID=UPI00362716FC